MKAPAEKILELGPAIIAEVKTQSPFGWKSPHRFERLLEIAVRTGDVIAVPTDPRWGGSFELLKKAAELVREKPILAKGIHPSDDDVRRALDAGVQ